MYHSVYHESDPELVYSALLHLKIKPKTVSYEHTFGRLLTYLQSQVSLQEDTV